MKPLLYIFILLSPFIYPGTMVAQRSTSMQGSPEKTVINFLKWYKGNEKRLNNIRTLYGGLQDSTTFYTVDFKETANYINELRKSNFFSEVYLSGNSKYFIDLDKQLRRHPQNDGEIEGFGADIVMKAIDYMDVWETLDSPKKIIKETTGNKAVVKIRFIGNYKTIYKLTRCGDKWFLDSLDNAFAEKWK